MKRPIARPTSVQATPDDDIRTPRAFMPAKVEIETAPPLFDALPVDDALAAPPPRGMGWVGKLAWGAGSVLVSLALGLAAERLISDLYAQYEWLGWLGLAVLAAFVVALVFIATREILALRRLRRLDRLKDKAAEVLLGNHLETGKAVLGELQAIYLQRPDMARARDSLALNARDMFDGAEIIRLSERLLMAPLDARAKALTAASARRVALVTTVSPRALVDIAFVAYESIRLGGAIAALYGARPGFFGFWRLTGAVLGHLAVTGGLALSDGVVEQLVGQGLAAKLSARLGEGLVNGLMTVRVGIAAMRVVRPLPFDTQKQPMVKDFMADLANVARPAQTP